MSDHRWELSQLTDLEREVILLKAVTDLIDDMVNLEMFLPLNQPRDAELRFKTMSHRRLFVVLLVDLLSTPRPNDFEFPKIPKEAVGSAATFIHYLRSVAQQPTLNPSGAQLAEPVEAFASWLDGECCEDKVWLPSIDLETTIRTPRISFIRICGDVAKHSFPRMGVTARRLQELFRSNGHDIDLAQAYLVMPDFYEWFHGDVLAYHSSAMAEFLNNIRWGIYEYLQVEFTRAYSRPDPQAIDYTYDVPPKCASEFGRAKYWELMNWVRARPMMPRFEVSRYLKMRH